MSGEDKTKLDSLEKVIVEDKKVEQVNTTTNNASYRVLFSNSADDTTKTEGTRKSAKLLFNPSTGALTATALIGKLDWSNLNEVPESFTPAQHTHNTSEIIALTNYSKASSASDLVTTDTLNAALGKLEYKADRGVEAYNIISAAYDGDGTIENLNEILKVLEGISDTDTIQAIIGKYLPLTGGTLSGTSAGILSIDRTNSGTASVSFCNNGIVKGYLGVNTNGDPVFANKGGTAFRIWHTGNDGSNSGLDADLLDGQHGSYYAAASSLGNYLPLSGGTMTGKINFSADSSDTIWIGATAETEGSKSFLDFYISDDSTDAFRWRTA